MTTSTHRPGARNTIADVPGVLVGSAEDLAVRTGVTVVIPPVRAVAAVDVRGGGPGTRETDLLAPENLVDAVDAIVLSGHTEGVIRAEFSPDGTRIATGCSR